MKNKVSVSRLAIGNLKARKKQYIIMIIGIILAMVFSSSVVFAVSAISNSLSDISTRYFGSENVIWSNVTDDIMRDGKEQGIFKSYGYAYVLGELYSTDKDNYEGMSVARFDKTAMEFANPVLIDGRMPAAEGEIAIETIMLSKMGIDARVGDKITLELKVQNGSEVFDEAVPKTYTLVGILENKVNHICFSSGVDEKTVPAAYVYDGAEIEAGGRERLVAYAKFTSNAVLRENSKHETRWGKFLDRSSYELVYRDVAVFTSREALYLNNSTAQDVPFSMIFVIIIISVFMLASCMVIINAFNSNLKERKKQIGMLRAVGATKRQIVKIYSREALILSLITSPVSCVLSYLLVKIIVGIMGDKFSCHPSWWVFPLTILFGIISVMLSAMIPLFAASRITPIQSIRNIENARKMKAKRIKTQKEYNVSSLLSSRSVTFGKGKQISVTVILVISIIASGFAVSYYTYAKDNPYSNESDYMVSLMTDSFYSGVNYKTNNSGFSQIDKVNMEANPYITATKTFKVGTVNMLVPYDTSIYRKHISGRYTRDYDIPEESISKDNFEKVFFSERYVDKDYEKCAELLGTDDNISVHMTACNSEFISSCKNLVYDGKIDIKKLNSGEEVILVAPSRAGVMFDDGRYGGLMNVNGPDADIKDCIYSDSCDFSAGDEIEIATITAVAPTDEEGPSDEKSCIPDDVEITRRKVKIGAIIEHDFSDGYDGFYIDNFCLLTTNAGIEGFVKGLNYKSISFALNQPCNDKIDKAVTETLNSVASGTDQSIVQSNYGYQQTQREDNARLLIALMAIIVLIFTIALSIVNNSITSDIRNSKVKIGTLRAVGADVGTLVKTYTNQMLSMIMWGVGIGLGGFAAGFVILYIVSRAKHFSFTFVFNPIGSLIFVAILIIICCVNLYLRVKSEMKNSIVQNIREL